MKSKLMIVQLELALKEKPAVNSKLQDNMAAAHTLWLIAVLIMLTAAQMDTHAIFPREHVLSNLSFLDEHKMFLFPNFNSRL